MARINVEDQLRVDPRFLSLSIEIGRLEAYGAILCLWEIGMTYWKKDKTLIPSKVFDHVRFGSELVRHGFGVASENGVYCSGANEHWAFLLKRSEAGKAGGIASVKARQEKYGTSIPSNARNLPYDRSKPKPSSSSSSSSSKKEQYREVLLPCLGSFLSKYEAKGYTRDFLESEWERLHLYYRGKDLEPDWSKIAGWFLTKWTKARWNIYQTENKLKPDPFTEAMSKLEAEMKAQNGE